MDGRDGGRKEQGRNGREVRREEGLERRKRRNEERSSEREVKGKKEGRR